MRQIIAALALALALAACGFTTQGDAIEGLVKKYGAQAYDKGLEHSVYFLCIVASKGSIDRKFGTSQALADSYNQLCGHVKINIINVIDASPEAAPLEQPP